jgi:hypothetical protein
LMQTVQKNWQDDDRPLQFEDTTVTTRRHVQEATPQGNCRGVCRKTA